MTKLSLPIEVSTNGIEGEFNQCKVFTNCSLDHMENDYTQAEYLFIETTATISTLSHLEGHSIEMTDKYWLELTLDWCFDRVLMLHGKQILQYTKVTQNNREAIFKAQIDKLTENNKGLIKRSQRRAEEIGMLFNHNRNLREALRDLLEQYPSSEKAHAEAAKILKTVENELENWNVTLGGMSKSHIFKHLHFPDPVCLTAQGGHNIEQVADEAIAFCKIYGCRAKIKFNGIDVYIHQYSKTLEIVRNYLHETGKNQEEQV